MTEHPGVDGRVGWGILSTGHIASVLAQDLALLPAEAELVAVGSRSADKAERFAAEYGFARAYGSYPELADDDEVDVVYVATPHSDHLASARLCLEAGKAVLVEKPITLTAGEARELFDFAAEQHCFAMEAMWSRTNPLVRRAAELVRSGELGGVRHLDATFGFAFDGEESHRLLNPDLGGGAILDLGVYPAHLANLFLGEPDEVLGWGSLASTGVDAHAAALLSYPAADAQGPATAALLCTLEASPPSRLTVLCERGRIEMADFLKPEQIEVYRGTDGDAEPEVLVTSLPGRGYTFQVQEVMRALRAGELESPLVPWADSLATMRTLDRWRAAVFEAAADVPA